jgi:hypothetical protein
MLTQTIRSVRQPFAFRANQQLWPDHYGWLMSGKQDKRARRARRNRPERQVRAAQITEAAKRIGVLDLADVLDTRVAQFAVGWLRAAFAQADAIVRLSVSGLDYAAAPNRRSFAEIALRLQWLHELEDRSGAPDALVEEEKRLAKSHVTHLEEMGLDMPSDFSGIEAVVTNSTTDKKIRVQAKNFTEATKATQQSVGLFRAWREETQFTHATGALAVSYAPASDGSFGIGKPFVADPEFETLLMVCLLVLSYAVRILLDEGTPQATIDRIFDAFFDGINAGL